MHRRLLCHAAGGAHGGSLPITPSHIALRRYDSSPSAAITPQHHLVKFDADGTQEWLNIDAEYDAGMLLWLDGAGTALPPAPGCAPTPRKRPELVAAKVERLVWHKCER